MNKISKNNNFEIKKEEKKIKDAETQIIQEENKVEKMDDFDINNLDYVRQKRMKELMRQIIYKKLISEKLILS